jgi:hypothetical protein
MFYCLKNHLHMIAYYHIYLKIPFFAVNHVSITYQMLFWKSKKDCITFDDHTSVDNTFVHNSFADNIVVDNTFVDNTFVSDQQVNILLSDDSILSISSVFVSCKQTISFFLISSQNSGYCKRN